MNSGRPNKSYFENVRRQKAGESIEDIRAGKTVKKTNSNQQINQQIALLQFFISEQPGKQITAEQGRNYLEVGFSYFEKLEKAMRLKTPDRFTRRKGIIKQMETWGQNTPEPTAPKIEENSPLALTHPPTPLTQEPLLVEKDVIYTKF